MNFGEVLKKIRKEKKDTVRSLAGKAGISYSFIGRVEKNSAPVSSNFVEKIAAVYKDREDELLNAYMLTKLPNTMTDKLNKNSKFLLENGNDEILANILYSESSPQFRKYILQLLVAQRELEAKNNGTYEERKQELEVIKKEIEKL